MINVVRATFPRAVFIDISSPAQTRLFRICIICHIKVEIAHIAKNHLVAVIGNRIRNGIISPVGYRIPAVDSCKLVAKKFIRSLVMPHSRLLPSSDLYAFGRNDVRHTDYKIFVHIMGCLKAFFLHQFPHIRRTCPRILGHFVATCMEERHLDTSLLIHKQNLVNHLFKETVGALLSRIKHIIVISLSRCVTGCVVPIPKPVALRFVIIILFIFLITCFH